MTSYIRAPLNFSAHQRPTVGDQKMSFTGYDHMGWLLCDGRSLSRTEYEILFNIVGTAFGSADEDHFNLPDFRGRVPGMATRDLGSNANQPTEYFRGDATGTQTHVLDITEMPTHNHGTQGGTNADLYNLTSTVGNHDHTGYTGYEGNRVESEVVAGGLGANVSGSDSHRHTIPPDGAHSHTLNPQGGSNAHNNMQPTLFAANMFIYCGKPNQGYFPYTFTTAPFLS